MNGATIKTESDDTNEAICHDKCHKRASKVNLIARECDNYKIGCFYTRGRIIHLYKLGQTFVVRLVMGLKSGRAQDKLCVWTNFPSKYVVKDALRKVVRTLALLWYGELVLSAELINFISHLKKI